MRGFARTALGALAVVVLAAWPAAADEALLRRALGAFMRAAEEFRLEAIPDLYEGGYARISVQARRVVLTEGMRVDEVAIRLVGVSLDAEALRAGTLRVLDFRDSAMQVRVLLRSLQEYFNASSPLGDIRLWADNGYLHGTGTVLFNGRPTAMRMKGFFAASGATEVYFYFDYLHANGWPLPTSVIRDLERAINPILHQRQWPVTFKIRTVRLDAAALTVSTQADGTCVACGGGPVPSYAP
ncbi:MAG: LmeA family phospholipid-binding protein [Armatimonadota bacterium]|nr:LmeA family phospholipid-binding protein [Armatimonadota bacterium]MDR7518879.1 LmeA family phospholipid-binding protein [Armatimonadota bacterium]MDR7549108.1 LmeA family phospholipid-binding protein [Armatimonadota bacterium]